MFGFKIKIDNRVIQPAVNNGVVVITIDTKRGLFIRGRDLEAGIDLDWGLNELSPKEKITVTPSETNNIDTASVTKRIDRNLLIEEYYFLKKFLTEKGVIK